MTPLLGLLLAIALSGLAATYVAYPLAVVLLARARRPRPPPTPTAELPRVSFIITAFNEADAIGEKLENTRALDWPVDRLEVIVASDGSTDATDAIVEAYPDERVRLVRNELRSGKTATTALAVGAARGEILVMSDATGVYNRDAIRELVAAFADPSVGAVSGRVTYDYGDSETARGFRLYQRWVTAQRRAEQTLHTVTSVSGSIHALRREVFEVVPPYLSYDMVVPALAAMRGQRCAYADGATSREASRTRAREEFDARVRIAVRAYAFLGWLAGELPRVRGRRYLVQLFLHKVLRWFAAELLLLLLVCNALLAVGAGGIWAALLWPHLGLYALAGLLARFEGGVRFPGSAPLLLFATVHAAYALGFWRWLRGERTAAWLPERAPEASRPSSNSAADR